MTFDTDKKKVLAKLYKPDKSKKGDVDIQIDYLIDAINEDKDLYTTSSCAGRIVLLKDPESGKKHEAEWPFSSHDEITYEQLIPALNALPEETLWFRMEAVILHVCARTIEAAQSFLDKARSVGLKRAGIFATQNKIMLEVVAVERIDTPIAENGNLLIDTSYLKVLAHYANNKLRETRKRAKRLHALLIRDV